MFEPKATASHSDSTKTGGRDPFAKYLLIP
jgi:hypothetical protein